MKQVTLPERSRVFMRIDGNNYFEITCSNGGLSIIATTDDGEPRRIESACDSRVLVVRLKVGE